MNWITLSLYIYHINFYCYSIPKPFSCLFFDFITKFWLLSVHLRNENLFTCNALRDNDLGNHKRCARVHESLWTHSKWVDAINPIRFMTFSLWRKFRIFCRKSFVEWLTSYDVIDVPWRSRNPQFSHWIYFLFHICYCSNCAALHVVSTNQSDQCYRVCFSHCVIFVGSFTTKY